MKHANIPVFIPHLGCPNGCVFCNQRTITGAEFDEGSVVDIIENALSTLSGREAEIAFFGGSFTAIDRELMIRLLKTGKSYVDKGRVISLRCSTRPDAVSEEILDILEEYGVRTVELGIQSTDDAVLTASERGHSAACAIDAMERVSKRGFELIGQMMVALPASGSEAEVRTAGDICRFAKAARVYPTVIFKDTVLCRMAKEGRYIQPTPEEMVKRTALVLAEFARHGVPVIRTGLQYGAELSPERDSVVGEYDCAVGEKAMSLIYLERLREELSGADEDHPAVLVPRGEISKAVGQKKANKTALINEFGFKNIKFIESELPVYTVKLIRSKQCT